MDLSLPLRLTSLVQNSKLELAVASTRAKALEAKVTDVVIKLQVEDLAPSFSEKLLYTFPSNISLWQVLSYFERVSGINFTKRAVMHQATASSGYLVYETPVVQSFNKRVCWDMIVCCNANSIDFHIGGVREIAFAIRIKQQTRNFTREV